jgi:hypothetical protein
MVAGRGFWPGLCVSLKHNSKFGSFTIIAKGDFPAELNIPIPFSLVSNDVANDTLTIMPGYWFMYNMYALARNSWKYADRDKRTEKKQHIEYDFLAPDTINEIMSALELFEEITGAAWKRKYNGSSGNAADIGRKLLENNDPVLRTLELNATGFENTNRKINIAKLPEAYQIFKELIKFYAGSLLADFIVKNEIKSFGDAVAALPKPVLSEWQNVGGQLIKSDQLQKALQHVKSGRFKSWKHLHDFYKAQSDKYPADKLSHALAALKKTHGITIGRAKQHELESLLQESVKTKQWMVDNIFRSREKDYTNAFRKMVYGNQSEMNKVVGALADNPFILQEKENLERYKKTISKILRSFTRTTVS